MSRREGSWHLQQSLYPRMGGLSGSKERQEKAQRECVKGGSSWETWLDRGLLGKGGWQAVLRWTGGLCAAENGGLQGQAAPVSTLLCSPAGIPARGPSCTLSPGMRIASPGLFPPSFRERFAVPAGALGAQRKDMACKELQHPLSRCSPVFCGERQQFSRRKTWHHAEDVLRGEVWEAD